MRVLLLLHTGNKWEAAVRQTARCARPLTAALVGDRQSMASSSLAALSHLLHWWPLGAAALDRL